MKPFKVKDTLLRSFSPLLFFKDAVSAGFPSPAEDDLVESLDLNEFLIKHPAATFFVKVSGSSMIGAGIHDRDILIVDRSLDVASGKVVIAVLNGELTVKRLFKKEGKLFLYAENENYAPLEIQEDNDFCIWGVVTAVIHFV